MKRSIVLEKSRSFASRIIKMRKYLEQEKGEFVMSKQILRSGTSIGANIKEAIHGQSKPDFYAKMNISLKETSETEYWLELLHESGYLEQKAFESIYQDCKELLKLLIAITKTQKQEN